MMSLIQTFLSKNNSFLLNLLHIHLHKTLQTLPMCDAELLERVSRISCIPQNLLLHYSKNINLIMSVLKES